MSHAYPGLEPVYPAFVFETLSDERTCFFLIFIKLICSYSLFQPSCIRVRVGVEVRVRVGVEVRVR